jgi:hypothetical protein
MGHSPSVPADLSGVIAYDLGAPAEECLVWLTAGINYS